MSIIKLVYFEKGFNYSQDGPGNRLVYHLQGCNMRCPWCSNPEGMLASETCHEAEIDDLLCEAQSCKAMFFDGGGVTFTGGECTLQAKTLCQLLEKLRAAGISTAIESNASTPDFLSVAAMCDHVIVDYKHPDKECLAVIGGKLRLIEQNIIEIASIKKIHIRIPLIHGFNDDAATLNGFCAFFKRLASLNCKFDLELLCYHEYGKEKWKKSGREYTVKNGYISKETLQNFKNTFLEQNIEIIKT